MLARRQVSGIDSQYACCIARDAAGRRVLDSSERVHFSLEGAGTLLANYGVPDKSAVIEMANGRPVFRRPDGSVLDERPAVAIDSG